MHSSTLKLIFVIIFFYKSKLFDKVYNDELEKQKCFESFMDFCETFELYRGTKHGDEENEIVGEFKVLLIV